MGNGVSLFPAWGFILLIEVAFKSESTLSYFFSSRLVSNSGKEVRIDVAVEDVLQISCPSPLSAPQRSRLVFV